MALPASAAQYYWENPLRITSTDSRFPQAVSNGNSSAVFWEEVDSSKSQIYLSAQIKFVSRDGQDYGYRTIRRFAGPFDYSGEVPDMFSASMNSGGRISVAVLSSSNEISVFTTSNYGTTFERTDLGKQELPLVAPRLYSLRTGEFILFASLGKDESFSMVYSKSHDGISWGAFVPFEPAKNLTNPFLPVLGNTDKGDLLLFQAQYNSGTRLSYQLYACRTSNGSSWSAPVLVTDQSSVTGNQTWSSYHNQRPTILSVNGECYVGWERTYFNSENANIFIAKVDPSSGRITGGVESVTTEGNAGRPILFNYNGQISLVWFDNRKGLNAVYFSQKQGALWEETKLSNSNSSCIFAWPMITNGGHELSFVWQTNNSIVRLSTDYSVELPKISALSYTEGRRSKDEKVRFRVTLPQDSSGIAGYSYCWTQNKDEEPPQNVMKLPEDTLIELNASSEKQWYLKVKATDYAGNWSKSKEITYYRDLTPPKAPVITVPDCDNLGFTASNTFSINWLVPSDPSDEEDIAGYSWTITKAGEIEKELCVSKRHPLALDESSSMIKASQLFSKYSYSTVKPQIPSSRVMQKKADTSFMNMANGVYVFAVRAIDGVGNAGEASYALIYLNKYEPYTVITSIQTQSDIFGNTALTINGAGFTYDGIITKIYLTRKGSDAYDYVLDYANGQFKINSNNQITGIKLDNQLKKGSYYISLLHSDRGLYKSAVAFSIDENGTVKIEKEYKYVPAWQGYTRIGRFNVRVENILLAVLMLFALLGAVLAVRGITQTIKDFNVVNLEVQALMEGDIMPLAKKKKIKALKKKGGGLRFKLVSFTVFLVLMVSLLVSIPLGFIMSRTQEENLSKGLEDRVYVLLESLSSGTKAYLPAENVLELSYLPSQQAALPEASFVTITGFGSGMEDENASLDYVWATNDERITQNLNDFISTKEFAAGNSKINDETFNTISKQCLEINQKAGELAGEIASNIAKLNAEGMRLALKSDNESVKRRNEISDITAQLTTRMTVNLNELSVTNTSSYPVYNNRLLDRENTEFLFYRPVLYRQGSSQNFVRGIVWIEISTTSLIESLDSARKVVVYTALGISLFAIIIGTVGSMILAGIIVNPIRKLAKHVTMIGETANKEKLAGKEINIKSRDEIGQLGETVNEMTRALVKAAQDEHLLMDGKVVQQTFLPLLTDSKGNKETTAIITGGGIDFYGYYEGASGVSGDYFDYKKLDDRFHIVIKCDASGHGVPAALIMTVVATLFRKYFENWSYAKNGTDLSKLVSQINDFIESLGIKGKFATLILALIDTKTGDVHLCNAGDNIIHIFDNASKKQKVITLTETPAAGPLPSFMVEMKGGFVMEKAHLNKGDILYLYTDGIEEATRKFRDSNFNVVKCHEEGLEEGAIHGNHKVGQDSEQMEPERVTAIIEAVLNRRVYVLEKFHNPVESERLEFDFTKCQGTAEETIIALASVEKVFRMYKGPDVTDNDLVQVDKKIDAFLKKCFNHYDTYCSNQQEISEESAYLYYTNLREDEQLDDLTLVAVKNS